MISPEKMKVEDINGTPVLFFRDGPGKPMNASLHGGRYCVEFLEAVVKRMRELENKERK